MTISAKIIADSIGEHSPRLTTLQLRYPKFIHGEFMTHRVFSRNASSSRAIPVERLIRDVIDDPVYPSHFGKNQPGMSAEEECEEFVKNWSFKASDPLLNRNVAWDIARLQAIEAAQAFAAAGYHKQIVNRLLEPFCHINVVVTATEWSNFFALRCHPGAQPEMRMLAEAMRDAMAESEPNKLEPGQWHLPYVDTKDWYVNGPTFDPKEAIEWCIHASVARCARVSYLTQEGKEPNVEDDLKLYDRLVGAVPLHASPAEHQATPDQRLWSYEQGLHKKWERPELHGNLDGWIQFRKTLEGEC